MRKYRSFGNLLILLAATVGLAAPMAARTIRFEVNQGTNFAVAVAPDGKTMAFDLQGRIWVLSARGGKARPITPMMVEARLPVWSPDGQWLAFQYYKDQNWHIARVRKDGSGLKQLTFDAYDHREPAWQPDGRALIFSGDKDRSFDIYELELTSGAIRPLTAGTADDYYSAVSPDGAAIVFVRAEGRKYDLVVRRGDVSTTLISGASELGRPQWSPDGRRIAVNVYNSARGESRIDILDATSGKVLATRGEGEDIFPTGTSWIGSDRLAYAADGGVRLWNLAGRAVLQVRFHATLTVQSRKDFPRKTFDLTSAGDRPVMGILRPKVSPDGRQVAFTALGDLWLLNVGNPEPAQLTNDPFLDVDPTWSRDGRRLAYVSDRRGTGTMDLYVRDMATGEDRRVTGTEEDLLQPSWSPDGRTLAVFMREASDWQAADLYLVDLATGKMRKIYDKLSMPSAPSWSADGRKLSVLALRTWSNRFRRGDNAFFTIDLETGKGQFTTPDDRRSLAARSQFGPTWSPDGKQIAYLDQGLLWTVAVDGEGGLIAPPVQLSREYASYPSWTGDSRSLLFLSGTELKRVFVDGRTESIPLKMTWKRPANAQRLVVQAGKVFTGISPTYLRDVDIVIDDNIITAIVPRRAAWPNARIVDARDKAVIPGVIQLHNHQFVSDGEMLGRLWLSFGITSVREPGAEPYEALERRESWMAQRRIGPREFYANIFEGRRVFFWNNTAISSKSQIDREMKRALDLDYDFLKTYETVDYDIQRRIVDFGHRHGLMVAGHKLYPAANYGIDAVEHFAARDRMDYFDRMSIKRIVYDDVLELMRHSGIYITPTSAGKAPGASYLVQMDRHPEIRLLPQVRKIFAPRYLKAHDAMVAYMRRLYDGVAQPLTANELASIRALKDSGTVIGAGSDGGTVSDGYSEILEMIHFADAIGPYAALRSGTIDAARITGVDRYLGSVEVGKIADLVVVDGDPLANVADVLRVSTVVKDGHPYMLAELLQPPVSR